VRTTLHLCAVLGTEFTLREVIATHQSLVPLDDSEKEIYATNMVAALKVAVEEGIVDQIYEGGQLDDDEEEDELNQADKISEEFLCNKDRKQIDTNISYRFHHAMWQENILKLMLDSRKRLLHQIIAECLESEANGNNFFSMIKLFGHWKASGNFLKASSLALTIGKSFSNAGLGKEAVKILDEALDLWRSDADCEDTIELFAGKIYI
jgi:predicted DNA-binding ribbon-helix-helix protein